LTTDDSKEGGGTEEFDRRSGKSPARTGHAVPRFLVVSIPI